jgi:uncharacterized protein (TIGR00730 family)
MPNPVTPVRGEPLPECAPKPTIDEPDAPARLERIMRSPSYVRADDDPAFLHRDELRHARLQLEYLKPELTLREHGVRSTIVLFGGTRIVEPVHARRNASDLEDQVRKSPDDLALRRRLEVARRIVESSKYYDVAREFSNLVARRTCKDREEREDHDFVIMTGGGPGIMEAGNRGAFDAGRCTVGLNITLPHEQFPNPYITPELCFQFRYFALRKLHFLKRAKALVAFPGGYGTLDELFDALCLVQTRRIAPIPIVLVGEEFWRNALNVEFLADQGVIADEDVELVRYADTAEEIWRVISTWHGVTS